MKRVARVSIPTLLVSVMILAFVLSGCSSSKNAYPNKPFEFIAPAGPGGGWDTTIRMVAKVLGDEKIVKQPMPVTNKAGGGGGVALAYLKGKTGDPYEIVVYSPPILLINLTGQTKDSYKDLTPLGMLIHDYGAFAVPKNSPYKTIAEVFEALKQDPKKVKIAGTSSPGSMDHVQFLAAAKAAGVKDLKAIQYVAFQGGEGLANLMGGHVDLLTTGMAETVGPMQSKDIRVLAVTAPQRIKEGPMKDVPTLKEGGINSEFINWRGLFGVSGIPESAVKYWEEALGKMVQTQAWKDICAKNGWTPAYMKAADFKQFLDKANGEYKSLLQDVGLAGK